MSTQLSRVAIQGDRASFHEIAACEYYQTPIELVYCQSFEDVFSQLHSGTADKALVAVKNSSHGNISEVTELLASNAVTIEGQHDLTIQQHLIGLPNVNVTDIKKVISHPVALSQCSVYVDESLSNATMQDFHDTAAAVAYVKRLGDSSVAAIASEAAARLHGLEIISRSIQNDSENITTFQSLTRHRLG